MKGSPCTLILPIAALHDLMLSWQDFLLEDLGTAALVYAGDFEDLGRVHIRIGASSHDGNAADHAFVHLYALCTRFS